MEIIDKLEITHNAAHYLTVISEFVREKGSARLTDIYQKLDISAGSCLTTLKKLVDRGFVCEKEKKNYSLTPKGESLADLISKNEKLFKYFLIEILEVSAHKASEEACNIEHILSTETCFKLAKLMNILLADADLSKKIREKMHSQNSSVCWKSLEANFDS